MVCARAGPGIIDFVKSTVIVMNPVKNGLGMSYFWGKTADMLILAEDGPEMTDFLKNILDNDGPGRH